MTKVRARVGQGGRKALTNARRYTPEPWNTPVWKQPDGWHSLPSPVHGQRVVPLSIRLHEVRHVRQHRRRGGILILSSGAVFVQARDGCSPYLCHVEHNCLCAQHGGPTMSEQHASEHGNNEHNNARYQHITPRCAPRERKARGQEEQSKQGGGRGHDTSWPLSCTAIQSTCCLHVGQALEHLVNHGRMQSAQYQ